MPQVLVSAVLRGRSQRIPTKRPKNTTRQLALARHLERHLSGSALQPGAVAGWQRDVALRRASSIYHEGAQLPDRRLFDANALVLGICYGMQAPRPSPDGQKGRPLA